MKRETIARIRRFKEDRDWDQFHTGTRKAKRYRSIKAQYRNEKFKTRQKCYTGFTAQIIRHEIDHLGGVLI